MTQWLRHVLIHDAVFAVKYPLLLIQHEVSEAHGAEVAAGQHRLRGTYPGFDGCHVNVLLQPHTAHEPSNGKLRHNREFDNSLSKNYGITV